MQPGRAAFRCSRIENSSATSAASISIVASVRPCRARSCVLPARCPSISRLGNAHCPLPKVRTPPELVPLSEQYEVHVLQNVFRLDAVRDHRYDVAVEPQLVLGEKVQKLVAENGSATETILLG